MATTVCSSSGVGVSGEENGLQTQSMEGLMLSSCSWGGAGRPSDAGVSTQGWGLVLRSVNVRMKKGVSTFLGLG